MKKTIKSFSVRVAMMLLTTVLFAMTAQTAWAGDVLYADFSNYNKTMTLKCASSYTSGTNRYQFDGSNYWYNYNYRSTVTKVTIDQSCKNYTGTTLSNLFYGLEKVTTIEGLSNLRTDDVTDMSGVFYGCYVVGSLDLSGFNTAKVTNMNEMFSNCKAVGSLDLSSFNTANVTEMYNMFYNCQSLTTLDLSEFNTARVTNMRGMFDSCSKLTTLDLTEFNTASVTQMDYMFCDCTRLTTIRVGMDWTTVKVTYANNEMFKNCNNLVGGAGTTYNSSNIGKAYARVDGGNGNPGYLTYGDWAGSGDSNNDPYIIRTRAEFNRLPRRVNDGYDYIGKYFKLEADITYDKNTVNNFTPIGIAESRSFGGNFDGNGHTISGLNISLGNSDNVGLFGYNTTGVTIKNLTLTNSTISGNKYVGGIVGWGSQTTIENCLVTNSVTVSGTESHVGGIAGIYATIRGCVSAANVSGTQYVGGIVGMSNYNTIENCLYTGSSVTGSSYVGAIIGAPGATLNYNYYKGHKDCMGCNGSDTDGARRALEITSTTSGIGFQPTGTVTNYDVSGIRTFTGSTAIQYSDGSSTKYYAGATESVNLDITYSSPYEGFNLTGFTDGNGNTLTYVGGNTYRLTVPTTPVDITPAGSDLWGETDGNGRNGSAEHPYLITTAEGLDLLAKKVNGTDGYTANSYSGKYFELGNDITYDYASLGEGESNYTAIGTSSHNFWGHFDGKGHTISGIRINANADNQGLFGYIHCAEVKNVTIDDTRITIGSGNTCVGGIVGGSNVSDLIENCHTTNSVIVSGGDNVGGIVGYDDGFVRGCTSAATVSGNNRVGGLVGYLVDDDIENCLVLGATITGNENVGAIAGEEYYGVDKNSYYIGTSVNGAAGSIAYEFPAPTGAMGAAVSTYAADTNYEGITVYASGLAYNDTYYSPTPWGGSGLEDDPYVINNTAGLDKLASDVNGGNHYADSYFVLGNDIDYSEVPLTLDDGKSNFNPIGYGYAVNYRSHFSGHFDGKGHTISGIVINKDADCQGIFSAIDGAVVKNLTVTDTRITIGSDNYYAGAITGFSINSAVIENCHVTGSVTVTAQAGENNCYYVGGIVGSNVGTVRGCTSAATVSGDCKVGGIAGNNSGTIENCLVLAASVTADVNAGAIVGNNGGTLTNNYHTCSGMGGVNGTEQDGALLAVSSATMSGGFGEATTTYGESDYIGITAYEYGLYYDGEYYEKDPSIVVWSGKGTAENPYVIRTTAELDLLASKVNGGNEYSNTYFALGADIAYDKTVENNYTTIGNNLHPFGGTFDGQGHTVSGIRISAPDGEYKAIFGLVDGTVKNLVVSDCHIKACQMISGIVVYLRGTIENCHISSDVTLIGHSYVGGIVAENEGGTIKGCTSAATIIGTEAGGVNAYFLGGIVGYVPYSVNTPTLTDNLFTGTISGDLLDYIGAIVGQNECDETILTNNYHTCSNMGGVGNDADAIGSDVAGRAEFAVCNANKPAAITGDPTATYGTGSYIGITAYANGLFYNGKYYYHSEIRGDVNANGEVDIDDAVSILRHLVNKPNEKFIEAAAKLNDNDEIDIDDAVEILKFLVGKIDTLSRAKAQDTDTDEYDPD